MKSSLRSFSCLAFFVYFFWPRFVVFGEVNWIPLVLVCEKVVVLGVVIVFVNWIGFCRCGCWEELCSFDLPV